MKSLSVLITLCKCRQTLLLNIRSESRRLHCEWLMTVSRPLWRLGAHLLLAFVPSFQIFDLTISGKISRPFDRTSIMGRSVTLEDRQIV